MIDDLTPSQVARAFQIVLAVAEHWQQWGLLRATLRYITEADGTVTRLGPSDYLITYPKD